MFKQQKNKELLFILFHRLSKSPDGKTIAIDNIKNPEEISHIAMKIAPKLLTKHKNTLGIKKQKLENFNPEQQNKLSQVTYVQILEKTGKENKTLIVVFPTEKLQEIDSINQLNAAVAVPSKTPTKSEIQQHQNQGLGYERKN